MRDRTRPERDDAGAPAGRAGRPEHPPQQQILALQRSAGNAAVSSMLGGAPARRTVARDQARETAFDITGSFEGRWDSVQTVDAGVVSYGRHQATLAGGALEKVLTSYLAASKTETAKKLRDDYAAKVAAKDGALRNDKVFHKLLRDASAEPEMRAAQDDVFVTEYWNPAVTKAAADGLTSALAKAVYYDTHVQGGLDAVRKTVADKIAAAAKADPAATPPTEAERIKMVLLARRERLNAIADAQEKTGDAAKVKNAEMLRQAASDTGRVGVFLDIVGKGDTDLKLEGGAGTRTVLGNTVFGVDSPYRKVLDHLRATPPKPADAMKELDAVKDMKDLIVTIDGLKDNGFWPQLAGQTPTQRVKLAAIAVSVRKRVGAEVWKEELDAASGLSKEDRAALEAHMGKPKVGTRSNTQRVLVDLETPGGDGVKQALQQLNGQSMEELMAVLPELDKAGKLTLIETSVDPVGKGLIHVPRLKVAVAGVRAKAAKKTPDQFEHETWDVVWPEGPDDQLEQIRRFLDPPKAAPAKKGKKGAKKKTPAGAAKK